MNRWINTYSSSGVITALVLCLLGLLLLLFPGVALKLLAVLLGIGLLAFGLLNAALGLLKKPFLPLWATVTTALLSLTLGVLALVFKQGLVNLLQVLLLVPVLCSGILAVYESIYFKRSGMSLWWSSAVYGLLLLIGGVVALCNPFAAALVLTRITGVLLLFSNLVNVLLLYRLRKEQNNSWSWQRR